MHRSHRRNRFRAEQTVMNVSNTEVWHDLTLPRPRAAVNATVLRSVFSDTASRKVMTARAWSRVLHLATRGPAGCTMHSQLLRMTIITSVVDHDKNEQQDKLKPHI